MLFRSGNSKIPIAGDKMLGLHAMMEHTQEVIDCRGFTSINPLDLAVALGGEGRPFRASQKTCGTICVHEGQSW